MQFHSLCYFTQTQMESGEHWFTLVGPLLGKPLADSKTSFKIKLMDHVVREGMIIEEPSWLNPAFN